MNSPAQVATFLFGVMLSAGLFLGGVDPAAAEPPDASSHSVAPEAAVRSPAIRPHGRVYLFRGALGPIFSRGMDRLAEKIERAGVTANVYEFTICRLIAEQAILEYRADPAQVTLIGHSMGGYCALKFAEMLQAEKIPVSLIVTIDPAHVTPDVPLNVERYINIFLSKSVLGGGDVKPQRGYQGHYASYDLSSHEEISHINIEKADSLQQQLVAKIAELAMTPAKAGGEAMPLRYVVPAGSAIELWDSGMPVFAEPGDTLQKIAARYHLPLWSLQQSNEGADNAPLMPGERIIIARHLIPLIDISGQLSSPH